MPESNEFESEIWRISTKVRDSDAKHKETVVHGTKPILSILTTDLFDLDQSNLLSFFLKFEKCFQIRAAEQVKAAEAEGPTKMKGPPRRRTGARCRRVRSSPAWS